MTADAASESERDVLMVFFEELEYSQDADDGASFDVSLFGELVNADVGWALTSEGTSVQRHYHDAHETVLNDHHPTRLFDEKYWITDDELLTDRVRLRSGEVVSCTEYDVVLVSHVVFHVFYIQYLKRTYPELPVISVQDESIYEVESLTSRMQMHLLETLSLIDGFVSEDETYARWVRGVVDDVLYLPQPIPENHYPDDRETRSPDDCETHSPDDRETHSDERRVSLGGVPFNADNSHFFSSILTFQNLRDDGFDVEGTVLGVRDWQKDVFQGFFDALEHVSGHGFVDEGYYDHIAEYEIAIYLTPRQSAGRCSADFAAMGVPCVGSKHNDLQRRCFPELSVDPYDVEAATKLGERLLTDPEFYESMVEDGRDAIETLQNHGRYRAELSAFIDDVVTKSDAPESNPDP